MFRNIVSNLPFSPALVGQLGFYAKRLRKEEATRRMGLIFTALALVVQSFAVFSPPQAANASSNADFVRGGVSSVSDFLKYYDSNSKHIKDLYTSLGITRAEINAATATTIGKTGYYNWSMTSLYSAAQGQRSYTFYNSTGDSNTVYHRPMTLTQEGRSPYPVYAGYSKEFGWFAIKKDCGNLITKKRPPVDQPPQSSCHSLTATRLSRTQIRFNARADVQNGATIKSYTFTVKDSTGKDVNVKQITSSSQTAEYTYDNTKSGNYKVFLVVDTSLGKRADATDCVARFTIIPPETNIVETKTAINMTQAGADATSLVAKASDKIAYTITIENKGLVTTAIPIEDRLEDALQYSALIDVGGGTFNDASKTLVWPSVALKPGEKQSRTFVVQLQSTLAATNTGTSDGTSFDCVMTNTFGNSTDVKVDCAVQKVIIEQVVKELPQTGPRENLIFAGVLLSVVVYFYARARQTNKEVRLIRRDLNAGTI